MVDELIHRGTGSHLGGDISGPDNTMARASATRSPLDTSRFKRLQKEAEKEEKIGAMLKDWVHVVSIHRYTIGGHP